MNENLHTYIEPELEVRITALVLGEASEFEADELEKLISEKPELAIFHRRMQAMHDLLGETVKPKSDENWQLSAERRAILQKTFTQSTPAAAKLKPRRADRHQWKTAMAIAVCLLVCVVIFALVKPVDYKRGENVAYTPDIVSYSAASENTEGEFLTRNTDIVWAPESGKVDRSVARKPSIPKSSKSRVLASRVAGSSAVPVPEIDIPHTSQDLDIDGGLGSGGAAADPFADTEAKKTTATLQVAGKKTVAGGVISRELLTNPSGGSGNVSTAKSGSNYYFRLGDKDKYDLGELSRLNKQNKGAVVGYVGYVQQAGENREGIATADDFDDPFAILGEKSKITDGFKYPTEYEPPKLPNTVVGDRAVPSAFPKTPATPPSVPTDEVRYKIDGSSSIGGIVQREIARRSSVVTAADAALIRGRKAYAEKDYEKAAEEYKKAESLLPPGPALADRRHSYSGHLEDAHLALAQKYRRVGKYQEARELLGDMLQRNPTNETAKKQLEYLEDPIRISPALTYEHSQKVDEVLKKLYTGEGYYNLGKYDEAEAEMKKTLKIDPYNKAARRWLEKIAATKSDYYRSAYDHTRAELLAEVDKAWEMAVPPEQKEQPAKKTAASSRSEIKDSSKLTLMRKDLQKKSDEVAEKRKKLMDVAERVGVIWVESERGKEMIGGQLKLRDLAEKQLYEAKREKEQLKFQMEKLLTLNDDDLISVAADLPEVGFQGNYKKYVQAKRDLQVKMAQGLSKNHPDIKAGEKVIAEQKAALKKRAKNVRESLKHQLNVVEGRVEKMRGVLNEERDKGTDRARSLKEFNKLRKAYQTAQASKDQLEVQYDIAKTKAGQSVANPAKKIIPALIAPKALPDETLARVQPFSTFSLNVSDVSFKLAKASLLGKGQWPDASKVRTEEFVNAFHYGDPSPSRGEPVACAIEQSAHPFLQQRNLLRIGMKTAASGRSTPLRLTVLLDNSGSMEREDREASVLAAIQLLAAQLGPQDVITLVGFASKPRLLADRVPGDKAAQLVSLVANTPSEGGTNLEEALRLARSLALRQRTEGAQDRVVLITDGVANLGNTVPEQLAREIEIMRQRGIAFDACGVGAEGLNDDILESLTRKGDGRYYFLNRAEDADEGFAKQLAGALTPAAKNVKVQVKFNPQRVSRYRLLGFEKHRLKKKDFRNDKVDAAEMAAEEAGNAVYQIEVNPEGSGELGEVFVRFLDTNTNRMVERSWPLPYEPQAKSFDQAAPSMQLAGTAAMLGEKLHGTDAGSVRFPMISDTLGKLRAHYTADPKVRDLIRMCRMVK